MKAFVQLLFLATYLVSSYATTQHRITYVVDEVLHSGSRSYELSLGESCKIHLNYTRFAQAKKAGSDDVHAKGKFAVVRGLKMPAVLLAVIARGRPVW